MTALLSWLRRLFAKPAAPEKGLSAETRRRLLTVHIANASKGGALR